MQGTKGKILKILFIVSIAVSVFFAVKQLGKEFVMPFPDELKIQNPTDFFMDEDGPSAIIDSDNTKIIFLDKNHKVVKVDYLTGNAFISKAYSVTRDNESFYVLGEKYARDTNLVINRRLIRYDLTGNNAEVIFDLPKDMEGTTSKQKVFTDGKKFIFVDRKAPGDDTRECKVSTAYIENGKVISDTKKIETIDSILDAAYLPEKDDLYLLDYEDHVIKISANESELISLDNNRHAGAIDCLSNGELVLCDVCSGDIFTTDGRVYPENPVYNLSARNGKIFASGYTEGQPMIIIDILTGNREIVSAYKYSFLYEMNAVLTLLSIVYLLFLFIRALSKTLSKRNPFEKDPERRNSLIVFLAIVAAIGIAFFYSGSMKNQMHEDMKSELILENKFISEVYKDYLKDNTEFGQAGSLKEACNEINKRSRSERELFRNYIEATEEQNKFGAIVVLERVGDKFVLGFDSSDSFVPGQQLWYVDEELLDSKKDETVIVEKFGTIGECSLIPLYDGSERIIGAVGYARYYDVFSDQISTVCIELAMSLFTIFIIIYTGSEELKALVTSIKKKKRNSGKKNTEVFFIQTFTFMKAMLFYMDDVLMVIIASEMLKQLGYDTIKSALMISLLTVAKGVGGTLGSVLFTILPKKYSSKRNIVIGSIGIVLSAVGITFAVFGNRFYLFCLGKFVFMLLACFVYGTIDILYLNADSEQDRITALNGKIKGNISGSVLSVMLGGFISNLFGYAALYFFIALMGVLAVILFLLCFTGSVKKEDAASKEIPKNNFKKSDYVKLFFSPAILIYVFAILAPMTLAGGYKSFVFPLYSSEMNLPSHYITNLVVLAKVLSDLLIDPIDNALKKVDYWWRIVVSSVLIGLSFIAFIINDTIVWAVTVLVVLTVFGKLTSPSMEIIWTREVKERGLDDKTVGKIMTMVRHTFKSFRESVLSLVKAFCGNGINIVIGLTCSIGGALFALITRNTAMKKTERTD